MRLFEIIFCTLALVLLSPALILISILLRFSGDNEVFYRQERIGYKRKPFSVYKFNTMVKNSSSMGAGLLTLANDPRVLPFGRVLRKTKLNELPQLLYSKKREAYYNNS